MQNTIFRAIFVLLLILFSLSYGVAAPAVEVLGKDYDFPNKLEGLPAKLSDFKALQINSFNTSDGVKLCYWEAGEGKPIIFITPIREALTCSHATKQQKGTYTMSTPTEVIKEFLANTATDKVEAASRRLVAEDATYISLNFDNPELKQILPWTGTSKGPQAFIDTFSRVAKWWTIEDFAVTDLFGEGENVAVFGRLTYRSVSLGKAVTSPFSIHAKVR